MKIKVCGNTDLEQLKELNDLPIDYAGLIFYRTVATLHFRKIEWKRL